MLTEYKKKKALNPDGRIQRPRKKERKKDFCTTVRGSDGTKRTLRDD